MIAVVTTNVSVTDLILIGAGIAAGALAWRSKRGDFYKAVAEEKTAEADKLRADNTRLRDMTDITPILQALKDVTAALKQTATVQNETLEKVRDMNGSLRATTTAMHALADKLILDESARGLLAAAAKGKR